MPATNSTQHYQLPLYQPNDHFSVLGDLNGAMNTIDGELAVVASSVDGAAANASAALTAATGAESKAEEAKTSATAASVSAQSASSAASAAQTVADAAASDASDALTLATAARQASQTASSQAAAAVADATNALSAANGASTLAQQAVDEQGFLRSVSLQENMVIQSGDRVTDVLSLTLTGLVVGRVYSISAMMEMHVATGVSNDKNMVVAVDGNQVYKDYYNADDYRVTLSVAVPFKATSTSHIVQMKSDSAASASFDILADGTRLMVW